MCLNLCNVTTFSPLAFLSNTKPACHKLMHIASIIFFYQFYPYLPLFFIQRFVRWNLHPLPESLFLHSETFGRSYQAEEGPVTGLP